MWGYLKTWKAQRFNVAYDWHRINIYTLQQRLKSINSKDYRIAQSALCLFCSSFLHWKLTPWTQSPGFLTVWHQIAGFGQWEALAGVSQDKREGWGICFHFLPCLAAFSICVWYHPQLQLPSGHTYIKLPILLGLNLTFLCSSDWGDNGFPLMLISECLNTERLSWWSYFAIWAASCLLKD